jgi:hypothetical protein
VPLDRVLFLTLVLFGSALVQDSFAANLAYGTYLKAGFTPTAMVSDAQGNTYVTRVDVQVPSSFATASSTAGIPATRGSFQVSLSLGQTPSGPLALPRINVVSVSGAMTVWATQ